MPRVLRFARSSTRRVRRRPDTNQQALILALINDLQVLAIDRPIALRIVAKLARALAGERPQQMTR
jgi:hypothetical protein